MSVLRRRRPPSRAEEIVLAATAKARVEILIDEMSHSLGELREILVVGKEPDAREE